MWLWILLAVLIVLALALSGAAWYFFRFAILRAEKETTEEESREAASLWGPFADRMLEAQQWIKEHTTEHISLTSFDGLNLCALYIPADTEAPKGTLIVMHGYRSLATVDFAMEAEFLHNLGYRLIIPYQRSHGESEGKYITYGVKERFDCRDWALYAQARFGKDDIFLAGISMGCATVLMALDTGLPENVRGVIADCGFTTPWDIMKHVSKRDFKIPSFPLLNILDLFTRAKAGFSLKGADTRTALKNSTLPVLFIHGEKDDFVPPYMTKENYAACIGEKELHLVPEAAHALSFAVDTPGCEEKIAAFLKNHASP